MDDNQARAWKAVMEAAAIMRQHEKDSVDIYKQCHINGRPVTIRFVRNHPFEKDVETNGP